MSIGVRRRSRQPTHSRDGSGSSGGGSSPASAASAASPTRSSVALNSRPPLYQHWNPTVLLTAFALTLLLLVGCGVHLLLQYRSASESLRLSRVESAVQESASRQRELNRATREKWELYSEQRGNVTQLLLQMATRPGVPPQPTLCILGAGNLNDILLSSLLPIDANDSPSNHSQAAAPSARSYARVSLVDLDESAMRAGVERQMMLPASEGPLSPHALERGLLRLYGSELTRSYDTFNAWKRARARAEAMGAKNVADTVPSSADVEAWMRAMQPASNKHGAADSFVRPRGLPVLEDDESSNDSSSDSLAIVSPRPERFDVVSSVCLLSQLLDMLMSSLSETHASFLPAVVALRDQHLEVMIDLIRPGGRGLLVSDLVSSSTAPQLRSWTHAQLRQGMESLLRDSNFFTGTNPHAIVARIKDKFAHLIEADSVRLISPWRWRMGGESDKQFLVYAIEFRKRAERGETTAAEQARAP